MTAKKRQRGCPCTVSDGAIHEAIQTSSSVAEAARSLGVSHGAIYNWWRNLGSLGLSPAWRIKRRPADKDGSLRKFRSLFVEEVTK
jgi:transposase-like protein